MEQKCFNNFNFDRTIVLMKLLFHNKLVFQAVLDIVWLLFLMKIVPRWSNVLTIVFSRTIVLGRTIVEKKSGYVLCIYCFSLTSTWTNNCFRFNCCSFRKLFQIELLFQLPFWVELLFLMKVFLIWTVVLATIALFQITYRVIAPCKTCSGWTNAELIPRLVFKITLIYLIWQI